MRKTSNIELSLYDPTDTFDITGSSNSLNHNMEIIDQKFSDTPNSSDIEKVNKDIASLKTETGSLKEDLEQLKEIGTGTGSGVTTAQANSMWALVQKTAFAEALTDEELNTFKTAWGLTGGSGESGGETEKTLSSISATYNGGDVPVGTSLTSLTGITVTAHYSDGSTADVTGYTLSGMIAEGSNTITVSYGGKTTTFTVTGVDSGGTESNIAYLPVAYMGSEYWAYFPGVVAGDVYYIRYNIAQYAVLRDFSHWATVSASETTWTYEKYNDNYYKITFVKDYGDIGLATNSSWADLEYSTVKYSKNAVPVE